MLTKWLVSVFVGLVLVAGVVTGVLLTKDDDFDLVITANDISLEQGENVPLEYSINATKADINFVVRDENIVEIEEENVYGKSAGETEVVIRARYKGWVTEEVIQVTVTESVSDGQDDGDPNDNQGKDEQGGSQQEEEKKNEPDDGEGKEDNSKDDEQPTPPVELPVEVIIDCHSKDFKQNGDTLEIKVGKEISLKFLIEPDFERCELEVDSENVTISNYDLSGMGCIIEASVAGNYNLTIRYYGKDVVYKAVFKIVATD